MSGAAATHRFPKCTSDPGGRGPGEQNNHMFRSTGARVKMKIVHIGFALLVFDLELIVSDGHKVSTFIGLGVRKKCRLLVVMYEKTFGTNK